MSTLANRLSDIKPLSKFIETFDPSSSKELPDPPTEQTQPQPTPRTSQSAFTTQTKNLPRLSTQDRTPPEPKPLKTYGSPDLILQRYESWTQFLTVLLQWTKELVRFSAQSEQSLGPLLKEPKLAQNQSANQIHGLIYGLTQDWVAQEHAFVSRLKRHLADLEKIRKESVSRLKQLKSRSDLDQDEFLKRAELTAQAMAQLSKVCQDASFSIEKGTQFTSDPWLFNLYVLLQLKREVDEENRLRHLMVAIQKDIRQFETQLLLTVEEALQTCLRLSSSFLSKERIAQFQATLHSAVQSNWDTFVASNKGIIVDENKPEKNYLNINYPCKDNILVKTVYRGELERKMGVLSKYSSRFFVLTEAGFLHQFKLNEKVTPEYTIYVPSASIIPSVDITKLKKQKFAEKKQNNLEYYTLDIQRSGSAVLQRDKSLSFRTSNLEEMINWCSFLQEISSRPQKVLIQAKRPQPQHPAAAVVNSQPSVASYTPDKPRSVTPPLPHLPPPPPPPSHMLEKRESFKILLDDDQSLTRKLSIISDISESDDESNDYVIYSSTQERYSTYTPKLNI